MADETPDLQNQRESTGGTSSPQETVGGIHAPANPNAIGNSVNQTKKFFDMKIAGFTAVLSIYLTLIVREIIDKSLVSNGFGLPIDRYVLIITFLVLIIQHYFGALGAISHNHIFRLTSEVKSERIKDLVFFQIDFILQLIEFSLFYYTAHNIADIEKVAGGICSIMVINLVWSAYSYIVENERKRPPTYTTRWIFKYAALAMTSYLMLLLCNYTFVARIGIPLLITSSIVVEFYFNSDFHIMTAPKEFHE